MKKVNITEDYVSFEVAKLLKEKGFDECCRTFITPNVDFALESDGRVFNHILLDNEYAAPTLQMVMKWLRETHRLVVNIAYIDFLEHGEVWSYEIIDRNTFETKGKEYEHTYEDAVEAAIKYCLTNLI